MTILLLSCGLFIFFIGFLTGGGWQRDRDEKEINWLKNINK